ncbi:hypothetical protein [Thalassospira sp. CH_XMU1420-2]|jgi:hypothetical protein|uniref:hypothetical protein n=1 Tax=Thalassospira sp. CH_XMU1420-2 TaxID=3107769 RepID=UPI00300A6537|tara:strand:- start:1199 stop:1867 length:669 start_codon:yes stop_codon:yes gene_type:complete
MNFDQNIFAGTAILLDDPFCDRTGRGLERITFKLKHSYGKQETYFLCVAYGELAIQLNERNYEQGMLLSFSGAIKLVTPDQGNSYLQCNVDRMSALAHYTKPTDGTRAPADHSDQNAPHKPGPFDQFENGSGTHAGNQTVQQHRGQSQQRRPQNNPPQNTRTSQPRSGHGFSGVPGANGNTHIDKGPFPQSRTLAATPKDRAPMSADPWGSNGMRQAAANGF